MERFINDLSNIWEQLSEESQKDLAKLIVGERNDSDLNVLMNK